MKEQFTWHGGRLSDARAHFGDSGEPWIDLSTGISPFPWVDAADILPDWLALPDPAKLDKMEAIAAQYYGVHPANICAVPGSEMGLRLLDPILALPALYFTPCYRTHADIFRDSRGISGFQTPDRPSAVLLANPNNPDGYVVPQETLKRWLEDLEDIKSWLIIDEAFADVMPGISMAEMVDDNRRLILTRSFGKFFGLAGVRLGFILGPKRIVSAYRKLLGDWPVSGGALDIGIAAYSDHPSTNEMRAAITDRAAQLDDILHRHGYTPLGHCPLFRLIETGSALALFERLAQRHILTRPFDGNLNWLRFGLPADDDALERLDRALLSG
ncbi:MAG: threonine-phosphate decarboxylase [Parasphingorhabdus sp.]|uniref:threonine-phosphate decarboxylase n=1 Tax=Parasphingorhabdus sp. TaxID=2709688 RepID=UPI00300327D0